MCKEMGQDNDKEQFLFQSYNPSDLEKVISVQKEVVARCKHEDEEVLPDRHRHRRLCGPT